MSIGPHPTHHQISILIYTTLYVHLNIFYNLVETNVLVPFLAQNMIYRQNHDNNLVIVSYTFIHLNVVFSFGFDFSYFMSYLLHANGVLKKIILPHNVVQIIWKKVEKIKTGVSMVLLTGYR